MLTYPEVVYIVNRSEERPVVVVREFEGWENVTELVNVTRNETINATYALQNVTVAANVSTNTSTNETFAYNEGDEDDPDLEVSEEDTLELQNVILIHKP